MSALAALAGSRAVLPEARRWWRLERLCRQSTGRPQPPWSARGAASRL